MKEFKDILFDYDIYGNSIGPDAGAAFVSTEKSTDVHVVTGGDCFSGSCCPVVGQKIPGAGENSMPGVS